MGAKAQDIPKRDIRDLFGSELRLREFTSAFTGKTFNLQELSARQGDVYTRVIRRAEEGFRMVDKVDLIAACLVWPDRSLVVQTDEDKALLLDSPTNEINELFMECLSVCGLREDDVEREKKDSSLTDSTDSPTS